MQVDDKLYNFIQEHLEDEVFQLILDASHHPDVDVRFAVEQIAARQQTKAKLPTWYADCRLIFPSRLSAEQCSSEKTAEYKQRFVDKGDTVCDLTGGLGVDTCYFAMKASRVTYVEKVEEYCEAARHNMTILALGNVEVRQADAQDYLPEIQADVVYLDPARRGSGNKRLYAIEDCAPDISRIWQFLLEGGCRKVVVKLSPMLDIRHLLTKLPAITEIHVVSIKNDCKELLVVADKRVAVEEPKIVCVDLGNVETIDFQMFLSKEASLDAKLASSVGRYLYEPNASIMKAGAYRTAAVRFGLYKLDVNSHLYTSDEYIKDFPGRKFEVLDTFLFSGRLCRNFSLMVPQANITARNFPLSADELRKRLRVADGGDTYLFATTMDGRKVIVQCRRIGSLLNEG